MSNGRDLTGSRVTSRTARWVGEAAAVVAVAAFAFGGVPAAGAAPRPRGEEWWFSTWDVQGKIWPITTGRGVTVAVLDGGVNAGLPDLADAVLPGADLTGRKDDGRVDLDTRLGGHGTAMAALIAGQGPAMVGVAPGAKILPVTVDRRSAGVRGDDAQAEGIRYAVKHGAKVISMSTVEANPNGPLRCDDYLQDAVDFAIKHDVVLVAAAGNDGDTTNGAFLPASCPGVLGVGAVDSLARPWVKTERQPYVAVAAPGVDAGSIGKAGVFSSNSGTSTSTALTAGAVALVRAKFPAMSGRQVVQRIIATARDTGPRGVDSQAGYGLVRPYHALTDRVPAGAPNPVYDRWDQAQRPRVPAVSPSRPVRPVAADRPRGGSGGSSLVLLAVRGLGLGLVLGGVAVVVWCRVARRRMARGRQVRR